MTKVIRKAQIWGLSNSAASRKAATAKLVEAACTGLPADRRPSSIEVWKQGKGGFGISAVSSHKRHLGIVQRHQAEWDRVNGRTPADPAEPVAEVASDAATDAGADPASDGSRSDAPPQGSDAGAAAALLRRAEAAEAEVEGLRAKLDAALEHIERTDAELRRSDREKAQLKLDLERHRSAPRARLPKVHDALDRKPTSH